MLQRSLARQQPVQGLQQAHRRLRTFEHGKSARQVRCRLLDVTWIIAYLAITAVISFTIPNISWEGHLGGFITGAAVAWIFLQISKHRRSKART